MLVPSTLLLLLCASLVDAMSSLRRRMGESESGEECRTPYSAHENQVMKEAFAKLRTRRRQTDQTYIFDVNVNAVAANMTYDGGWVPDSHISGQMDFLNKGYEGTGISFKSVGTTRIISPSWFAELNVPETEEQERTLNTFGRLFRKGKQNTLNLNLIGFLADETTYGFGLPPSFYSEYPFMDGIYIRYNTLPGGDLQRIGTTVVHEVGHWLSLWHTFQNGCEGEGDSVDDTPAEMISASGCPIGRDSCSSLPGLDPIRNFMDYSNETCRDSFTPGQISRMHDAAVFRLQV